MATDAVDTDFDIGEVLNVEIVGAITLDGALGNVINVDYKCFECPNTHVGIISIDAYIELQTKLSTFLDGIGR